MAGSSGLQDLPPNEFVVGRHTYFDFGPPFDYYEVFHVQSTESGSTVQKITITPAGVRCMAPPRVELVSATIDDLPHALLEGRNPCAIPERQLRRERERRKKGLSFSGAEVSLKVLCGGKERIIRADILDRDWFDPKADTPNNTSWTMRLLARLDEAAGPGVGDRPIIATEQPPAKPLPEDLERRLLSGEYDKLFPGVPHRLPDLYRDSHVAVAAPTVQLVSSVPFAPKVVVLPDYPAIARLARIEGRVVFAMQVDTTGNVRNLEFESGHPMLRGVIEKAVNEWRFAAEAADQKIKATLEFKTNCVTTGH